jgi:cholesterol transport system auxiliary component
VRLGWRPAAGCALQPATLQGFGQGKLPWTLLVDDPSAASGLDTDRIAVRETPLRLGYYAGARWAEPAPRMVRDVIISAFENAGRLKGVGQSSVNLNSKYRLSTRLIEFEAVYPTGGAKLPETSVKLDARLTQELGQAVVASQTFAASRPAASADLPEVVEAYNQALAAVLSDLIPWTLKTPPNTS